MNRREFGKMGLTATVLFSFVNLTGCIFGNVVSSITAYIGVGIAAIKSVVAILQGAGIVNTVEGIAISAVLTLIQSAWADVTAAIAEYENAPATNKQTLLGKVSTALQSVADQIQKFWTDLSIPDSKLAALIQGLLGVVLSTIAGFLTQLPQPTPAARISVNWNKSINVIATKRNEKQFRNDFNSLLHQGGYDKYAI